MQNDAIKSIMTLKSMYNTNNLIYNMNNFLFKLVVYLLLAIIIFSSIFIVNEQLIIVSISMFIAFLVFSPALLDKSNMLYNTFFKTLKVNESISLLKMFLFFKMYTYTNNKFNKKSKNIIAKEEDSLDFNNPNYYIFHNIEFISFLFSFIGYEKIKDILIDSEHSYEICAGFLFHFKDNSNKFTLKELKSLEKLYNEQFSQRSSYGIFSESFDLISFYKSSAYQGYIQQFVITNDKDFKKFIINAKNKFLQTNLAYF